MSTLLFGPGGQVGARLAQLTPCIGLGRAPCDFTRLTAGAAEALLAQHAPVRIINAAGFTAVDAAESQVGMAEAVNAAAPRLLAEAARKQGIPFIHFSTDYVFDGAAGPYGEEAPTNPLSVYGRTKRDGEQAVLDAGGTVFRLQWVFDNRGSNFLLTLRRMLAERAQLNVVADQRGAPGFAGHIARAVLAAQHVPPGLYHMAAAGDTSWHGFACAIAEATGSRTAIAPITTAEYAAPAARPRDARLDCSKLAAYGIALPHWRDGLKEALHATA